MKAAIFGIAGLMFFWSAVAQAANIAVVAPKVGYLARYGHELAEGAQIAVDLINQEGGVLGDKVSLISVDDRCEDSFAVSAAQMMSLNSSKNDKVNLVIGPYCDNAFERIADIYAKGKIIRILPMPLASSQMQLDTAGLFKIGGLKSNEADAFFKFYKKQLAGKNLAVVYNRDVAVTTETAFDVQELFRGNNLAAKLTLYDFASYGKKYRQMAKEILLNNSAVYILGKAGETAKLAQRLQEEKEDVTIVVDEYLATPHFFREMGNFVEDIYVVAKENMKDNPSFTEELVELRLKGKEPKGLGVYGYAAVQLWRQMVEKSGSIDFDKVISSSNGKFMLPWGEVDFVNGVALVSSGHIVYQVKNGEYAQAD